MRKYTTNPNGKPVPIYTREDLERMGKARKDATLNQIWPSSGKPGSDVFYFDMGNGELRPSILIPRSGA